MLVRHLLLATACLLATRSSRLAAQGTDSATAGAPPAALVTPQSLADGRSIFHGAGNCYVCHGAELEGGPIAPTLKAHKWRNGDGTYPAILHVVMNGVTNTAMVTHPGGISDAQATRVAAYVWAVGHGKAKP